MKYNQENIEKLAKVVVDSWDMKALVQFAIDRLIEAYVTDEEAYNHDYNIHKDELKGDR